jgi:RNA polymerase sigma-B factor
MPSDPGSQAANQANNQAILDRFGEYRRTADRRIRNELVEQHRWLAMHCARRFGSRSEPMDDLIQVAMLGILKAVERFDPAFGVRFATFAVPTVLGELRRHFRDKTWSVHVARRLKDLYLSVNAASEQLGHDLGRPPTNEELADYLNVTVEEIAEAVEVGGAYRIASLSPPDQHDEDADHEVSVLGELDRDLNVADLRLSVRKEVADLPERERKVVYLRFYEGLTQSEIAEQVGCSQVHVSRILRATLERLENRLSEPDDDDEIQRRTSRSRPQRTGRDRPVRLPASVGRS